jgi:signal transduction histidine kinase/CheY-like chemotaxis protein
MSRVECIFKPSFKADGTVLIDDVNDDPRYGKTSNLYSWIADNLTVASYLSVPVVSRSGEIFGGLFFGHPEAGVFSERDARVVEGIAAQAAIAIDNARLYEVAKQAAHENERLYKQAEESSQLKEEFLATVSHELRNPLSAILGWSRLLRTGKLPPHEIERALETIDRNARTQTQLIDDLLDVSRIITGKLRMDVHPIVPNLLIEAVIEAVQPAADAKGVLLEKVIDTSSPAMAGDPVRLQQVVWNLLSNAIKFTPRGGWVRVVFERIDSHLEIVVSDSGQGISSEFLPYVFDRFRQADQRNSRRHGGMGLGLAIVKHLVEMHGGSVKAFSEGEDQGATFRVMLPIVPVYQTAPETNLRIGVQDLFPTAEIGERLDHVVVLVVDDESDTRELLKVGLENCGAQVVLAASVAEALQKIEDQVPDILISDIGMPEADGYELIRRVRRLPQESGGAVPAIALTAYARVEDRLRALRSGFNMHVPKPVELAELVAVADSLVKRTVTESRC